MDRDLRKELNECLRQLEASGDVESCLARHPERAQELRPYLELAATLASTKWGEPSAADHQWGRQRLLSELAEPNLRKRGANQMTIFGHRLFPVVAAVLGAVFLLGGAMAASAHSGSPIPGPQDAFSFLHDENQDDGAADDGFEGEIEALQARHEAEIEAPDAQCDSGDEQLDAQDEAAADALEADCEGSQDALEAQQEGEDESLDADQESGEVDDVDDAEVDDNDQGDDTQGEDIQGDDTQGEDIQGDDTQGDGVGDGNDVEDGGQDDNGSDDGTSDNQADDQADADGN